jgi:hypothetical protein
MVQYSTSFTRFEQPEHGGNPDEEINTKEILNSTYQLQAPSNFRLGIS